MYHSITFGDGTLYPSGHEKEGQFSGVNTWDDWHLIPASRPVIASPGVSSHYVDIPGKSGGVDMTDYLRGRPIYGARSGNLEFYVDNDHEHWETIRMKIMNFLHGRKYKICLEDDPRFFWEGRFAMNEWKSEAVCSKIVINYALDPYKTSLEDVPPEDFIWNIFNFERDTDWGALLRNVAVTETPYSVTIPVFSYPFAVSATLVSGESATVTFGGNEEIITPENPVALLSSEAFASDVLTVTGNGVANFMFRERSL